MNGMKPKLCATALLVAAAVLLPACSGGGGTKAGGSEAPITLSMGTDDSPGSSAADQIEEFARRVEKLSGGKVRVRPVWHASGPRGVREWDQLVARKAVAGELDLGLIPARAWDTEGVTSLRALHAPFLVTSDELLDRVLTSELADRMLAGLEPAGVIGLALLPEGLRHPFAYGEPLLSPADYVRVAVRAPRSETTYALFEALGARPDDPSGGEFDRLIASGSVAAAESAFAWAGSLQADTIATGNVTFFPKAQTLVINADVFEGLEDDQRRMLEEAAIQTRDWAIRTTPSEAEAVRDYCENGGRVVLASEAELAALEEAVAPVYDELGRDEETRALIDGIRALDSEIAPAATRLPVPCGSAAEAATSGPGGASVLDGVYRTSFTRADLQRSPRLEDPGEVHDENWGDFTLTFERGRVTFEQENDIASYTTSGTFRVDGETVVLEFTEGGNFGETFTFRWRLAGDELTFERVGAAPTPYVIEPWRRAPRRMDVTFPEGVYRIDLSRAFLLEEGLSEGEVTGIEGVGTLTFAGGRWKHETQNTEGHVICEGDYATEGKRVVLTFAGPGHLCGPEGTVLFSAEWARKDGVLRFTDVHGEHGDDLFARVIWGGKPWKNVD